MESYYDNNLAVTQQMKLEMMQKMQQQQLIQRLLVIEFIQCSQKKTWADLLCFVLTSERWLLQTPDPATKSRRAFWTDEEVHRLQELFNINPYPDQQAKRQLRYFVNWLTFPFPQILL